MIHTAETWWHVETGDDGTKYIYANHRMVAQMPIWADSGDVQLIAAAPDLLNAVLAFLHADPDAPEEARKAIAKAEGRT